MATNTAQDAVRCSMCTEVVVFLCGSCHVNLCGQCLPTHLDRNKSLKHEILSYTSESVQPKPQAPECQDHPGESRTLYCQDCNVPICSQCLIMTGNHNRHGAVKLADFSEKTRNIIIEDLIELHHFEKEYSMIVKDRENKIKKYTEHSNQEKSSLKKRGQELNQILTKAIETIEHELTDMVKEDLQILQNDKDKVQNSYQVVKDCIERNEHILNEENSFKMLEYKSIVEDLRLVPPMKDISPPKLILPDVKKEEIIKQVVSLQSSVHSTLPGFTISKTGDVTMASTLTMMEEPTLLVVLLTHCTKLKGICCESEEKVWIYGDDEKIKQLDKSGNALNSFNAASGTSQKDIAMNSDRNIAFSHKEDACIYLVKKTKIEKFVDVSGWIPYGLCFNSDGDLMVCMRRNDYTESKVGVFADGTPLETCAQVCTKVAARALAGIQQVNNVNRLRKTVALDSLEKTVVQNVLIHILGKTVRNDVIVTRACVTFLPDVLLSQQYIHHVAQDTLVQTVGENVPILITVRNVKVNVTVIRTYVTYLPDVLLLQQLKQDASPGTLVKTVEENVRIPITVWIVKISATVMRTDVISQPDVQILQKGYVVCPKVASWAIYGIQQLNNVNDVWQATLGGIAQYRVGILHTDGAVKESVTVTKTCDMFLWDALFLLQRLRKNVAPDSLEKTVVQNVLIHILGKTVRNDVIVTKACVTFLPDVLLSQQYIHHVAQDTLVQTVGENVPILITVRNVKVNVTVIRTYVTYLPDVSLKQQFKQNASPGTLVKTVEENVRILITAWIVKISATVMRTDVISQPDVQILQKIPKEVAWCYECSYRTYICMVYNDCQLMNCQTVINERRL
uniref:B box-type domain-containing protein n=1 Tax=Magallana gigas TaxID=29159 RepID=A0A8W8JM51_MAGGI